MTKTKHADIGPVLDTIIGDITWDNWSDGGKMWDVCQVLYCKLDWLTEYLANVALEGVPSPEIDEHIDTIEQLQSLLECLNERKLRSL